MRNNGEYRQLFLCFIQWKVVLIPILSPAFDSDFAIQIALRSVAAFGNEARAEKWNAALGMIQNPWILQSEFYLDPRYGSC